MTLPPITPDGRYLIVRGVLWRRSRPGIEDGRMRELVTALMDARRAVKTALCACDLQAESMARWRVDAVKRELGERGEVWWDDGEPDYTQERVEDTPYARWWEAARRAVTHAK